jgi:hypothetical protein
MIPDSVTARGNQSESDNEKWDELVPIYPLYIFMTTKKIIPSMNP